MSHYCLEGIVHQDHCGCDCAPCEQVARRLAADEAYRKRQVAIDRLRAETERYYRARLEEEKKRMQG